MKLTEAEERWVKLSPMLPNGWAAYNFGIQREFFKLAFTMVGKKLAMWFSSQSTAGYAA